MVEHHFHIPAWIAADFVGVGPSGSGKMSFVFSQKDGPRFSVEVPTHQVAGSSRQIANLCIADTQERRADEGADEFGRGLDSTVVEPRLSSDGRRIALVFEPGAVDQVVMVIPIDSVPHLIEGLAKLLHGERGNSSGGKH